MNLQGCRVLVRHGGLSCPATASLKSLARRTGLYLPSRLTNTTAASATSSSPCTRLPGWVPGRHSPAASPAGCTWCTAWSWHRAWTAARGRARLLWPCQADLLEGLPEPHAGCWDGLHDLHGCAEDVARAQGPQEADVDVRHRQREVALGKALGREPQVVQPLVPGCAAGGIGSGPWSPGLPWLQVPRTVLHVGQEARLHVSWRHIQADVCGAVGAAGWAAHVVDDAEGVQLRVPDLHLAGERARRPGSLGSGQGWATQQPPVQWPLRCCSPGRTTASLGAVPARVRCADRAAGVL